MKETHYDPMEYSIAFKIFSEIMPEDKSIVDIVLKEAISGDDEQKDRFEELIEDYRDTIGDTLYSMYSNIYFACNRDRLNKRYICHKRGFDYGM